MPSIKDFFKGLAAKANFDIAANQAFFDALPDTDVPSEVQTGIDNSLISLKDAKNNHQDLKNHYHKQALDGIDNSIASIFDELEIPDEVRAEILAEKSTYKRVPKLVAKVAELKAAASSASGADKKEIQKQIDTLQAQIREAKAEKDKVVADYEKKILDSKKESRLENLLSSQKTIHDDLDIETKNLIIKTTLNKALQDNQAQFAFDENGNFTILKNDGSNYYGENHQLITPAQFIEQTLAKNKQLKVTGQPATPSQTTGGAPATGSGLDKNNANAAVKSLNDKAIADMAAAAQTSPV